MLREFLMSELDTIGSRPRWFMQDGAPPHYGLQVRAWLDQNFPHRWIGRRGPVELAPRSPDLNPMDFAIWGYLKAKVYSEKIRDKDHLRERIVAECHAITSDFVISVLQNFVKRVNLCIENNGQHFENII